MTDYISEKEALNSFYGKFPRLDNFDFQVSEKQKSFTAEDRKRLVEALTIQYKSLSTSSTTLKNIKSLSEENTFTITTGHQLNIFTGPLYFLYKIISVINLCEKLREESPNNNYVPIYWMASEDHDFDEINYFNLFGKKIAWDRESGGAVGALSTEGLESILEVLQSELGSNENAQELCSLFAEAYTKHSNLSEATRFLGNALFSEFGLVIVDGNDVRLKSAFIPYIEKELESKRSYQKITETSNRLKSLGYKEQVYPREINLFFLSENSRERIIKENDRFLINNTELNYSSDEILTLLNNSPEKFSPNALMRPLYQEVVLPNLCYIGGGGELAYWFQLKDYFDSLEVPFPLLLLRNSVLLLPKKYKLKLEKLGIDLKYLFLSPHDLEKHYTRQKSIIEIDFSKQKKHLIDQFKALHELASQTDVSFKGAVAAQEKKQLNGLDRLEKRLLRAEKRKRIDEVRRLGDIQELLFPNESLQERTVNFSEFYLEFGDQLIANLKMNLDPLLNEFTLLEV